GSGAGHRLRSVAANSTACRWRPLAGKQSITTSTASGSAPRGPRASVTQSPCHVLIVATILSADAGGLSPDQRRWREEGRAKLGQEGWKRAGVKVSSVKLPHTMV